jgi:hypothetical protein
VDALKIPLSKLLPRQTFTIVMTVLTYFFILSLVALAGGIGSYAASFILKDYVNRQRLIDAAQEGVNGGDINKVLSNASQLIGGYPNDPIGYKFKGVGMYMKGDFVDSMGAFSDAIKLFPAGADVCGDELNALEGNLAAAQGAAGQPEQGLKTLDDIAKCKPRPKMDAFNRAKMLLALGRLDDAEKALAAPELFGPDRPDLRSRVFLERAFINISKKGDGWEKTARTQLGQAISLDANLKQILCFKDGQADPGWSMLEDFGLEKSIVGKPENKNFFDKLRSEKLEGCE